MTDDDVKTAGEALDAYLEQVGGCSDGDCKIIRPVGMHTNGGCRCLRNDPFKAERVIIAYRRYRKEIERARNT